MAGDVIFISGPIGAGKTSLGRELAVRLKGSFLDGDDVSRSDRPWYACILQTSRAILRAGIVGAEQRGLAVVAYPLGCTNWIYFKRSFEDRGVRTTFVSLRASYTAIVGEGRGRVFSAGERRRIREMIEQGYGARPFSDLILDTDMVGFDETSDRLERDVRILIGR